MMKVARRCAKSRAAAASAHSDGGAETMPPNLRKSERNADDRDRENADHGAADDLAVIERGDQHEAEQAQDRRPLLEVAERDQRRRMRHHDLGLLQRDDAEEQADAGRDRKLEVLRDGVDDVFADAEDRDQEKQHARAEHRGQRLLPGVFVAKHHGEGEERVEPHAGRERNRVIGVERHHQGRHRRRDAGRDEHRARVHAGLAEDLRIDEHDVDHRQERGQTGDEFGADVGAAFAQAEGAVEITRRSCRGVAHRLPPLDVTSSGFSIAAHQCAGHPPSCGIQQPNRHLGRLGRARSEAAALPRAAL